MFRIAITLLVVAIIAAILGFGGIAGTATGLAKIVFVVALVLAVLSFLTGGRGSSALVALLALSLPAVAARADEGATTGVERQGRTGATFGIDIGAGHMGCTNSDGDDCDDQDNDVHEAGGLAIHGGFLVAPNVAILGELWGMTHTNDRLTVSQGILAGAVRFWPVPRLWLQGGVGVAVAKASYDAEIVTFEDESDTVPAAIAGVGFEIVSTDSFGLDVELKGGTGLYRDDLNIYNLSLGVGVSWF
jgi:uncharacterized membrane protein YtjA (UPF0391 family)